MSIVFASQLSRCELKSLGNNLQALGSRKRPTPAQMATRRNLAAVNRSLGAILDERVGRLYRRRDDDEEGLAPVPVGPA